MVRPDPFRGINHPPVQVGVNFSASHENGIAAGFGDNLAAQAGNSHFQPLEIVHGRDLFVEPAAI